MGFETEFDELQAEDKELFKKTVDSLLYHTFILPNRYDLDNLQTKGNPEHSFAFRNFSLLSDYFSYMGIDLDKSEEFSLIFIKESATINRIRFNMLTTQLLLMMRCIYDEESSKLSFSKDVKIRVAEIVQRLMLVVGMKKKPSLVALSDSLKKIAQFRIISKREGSFTDPSLEILIHPTILFIVSQERLDTLSNLIQEKNEDEVKLESEDTDEETE